MVETQPQAELTGRKPYILVAPNGARRSPGDHPALPVSTDQIVKTALGCFDAGARGIHLHVRDDQGQHSLDAGRYLETIAAVRSEAPLMDIQITTEAAGLYDVDAQFECLQSVRPDWASVSVREIARAPEMADKVYGLCAEQGTRVQHILYDAEDCRMLDRWQRSGIVRPDQVDRLLVLGRYTENQESAPENIDEFPQTDAPWMVCAFGTQEHRCLQASAQRGGDVRVGFENSLTDADGRSWTDNAASVAALVALLERTVR